MREKTITTFDQNELWLHFLRNNIMAETIPKRNETDEWKGRERGVENV